LPNSPEPLGRGRLLQNRLTAFNPLIGYQTCVVQIRAGGLPAGCKPAPLRARGSIPSTTHHFQVRSSKVEHVALNHSVRVRFSPDLPLVMILGCALGCRDALQATRAEFDSQAVHRTYGRVYADAGGVTAPEIVRECKAAERHDSQPCPSECKPRHEHQFDAGVDRRTPRLSSVGNAGADPVRISRQWPRGGMYTHRS
jgi:hypothetical protein